MTLRHQARKLEENPSTPTLYDYLKGQPTVQFARDRLPEKATEMYGIEGRIPVSWSGSVTARTPRAFVDLSLCNPHEQDFYQRLALDINQRLMDRPLMYTETNICKGSDFVVKVGLIVPRAFAKHALDFHLNNHPPVNDGPPDILLIADPTWVNPIWSASVNTRSQELPYNKEGAPPKNLNIFDRENYIGYLLGGEYFGELKKATLRLAWHMMKEKGIGAPLHASSKEMRVIDIDGKLRTTSFAIAGLSGTGKSTLGMHGYEDVLDTEQGEAVRLGNDDATGILFEPSDGASGLVGFEENMYNKTNDYSEEGSNLANTVVTVENAMLDWDGYLIYGDSLIPNGRCESLRMGLPNTTDDVNIPWPTHLAFIQKNETLPPVMLLEDPERIASYYMSIQTKPTTAENIPLSEIGKLKHVPGANPFLCGDMNLEADAISKAIRVTGAKALVINTDQFMGQDISKQVSLAILLAVARNEITWRKHPLYHGMIPEKGSLVIDGIDYDAMFQPETAVGDKAAYERKYTRLMRQKIEFIRSLKLHEQYVDPIVE